MTVGPTGATRTKCPEPEMSVEARFLERLSRVTQLRFVAGQLALRSAKPDETVWVMLFDRRPAR